MEAEALSGLPPEKLGVPILSQGSEFFEGSKDLGKPFILADKNLGRVTGSSESRFA
jgi:hypothetical protein